MLPKILVLHGYTQSAAIFGKRMGALRKTLAKDVELVFVDAPHILLPADLASSFGSSDLSALGSSEAQEDGDPALRPRAWWKWNQERSVTLGVDESLEALKEILRKDRYEAVWGFSQGASMAAFLTALLEQPTLHPAFLVDGVAPHPPFRFAVCVAGFRPRGALADALFERPYTTLTLHVLGRTDVIVHEERARTLLEVSANKRVVLHDGGHFVPSKAAWRTFFRAFVIDPFGDVPGPGEAPSAGGTPSSTAPATRASSPPAPAEVASVASAKADVRDALLADGAGHDPEAKAKPAL